MIFTDSKSLFDTTTSLCSITEKRLLIDICALRESYSSGELYNVGHVLSENNIANPLTKKVKSLVMETLLQTGTLKHPVNQWTVHIDQKKDF